jgi:hypothetical protein
MPLLTKISEIRTVLPRLFSKLSSNADLPNIGKAQRKYLQPILGKALIDDLQAKYTGDTLTDDEMELILAIQLPLAAYAALDDLVFIHVMITDGGIYTAGTDKLTPAHRWEYLELKNSLQDCAIDGIEQLLAYLYDNKADLALWTASDEYKAIDDFVIKTGTDFAKQYPLYSPLYTYWALKPVMADVEENYLAAKYGRDLLAWIKTQDTIEVTVPGNGMVDVKKLVKKAVAFLTIKHACDQFVPRLDKNGFTIVLKGNVDDSSSDGFTAASLHQIELKKRTCDSDGQKYLAKSASYLVAVANGEFSADFDDSFTTAFEGSPLKTDPNKKPWTDGNERRKIFTTR